MGELSALDELRELLAITKRCAAHARKARELAQSYAQHYKANAEEFKKQAACTPFPEIQARLLRIAAYNERLCNIAEGTPPIAEAESHAARRQRLQPPPEAAITRTAEDPVLQARRHVVEAEARIKRQEALVARLSYSSKHLSLAGQAREILSTLQQTLRLARDHLELELKKHSSSISHQ